MAHQHPVERALVLGQPIDCVTMDQTRDILAGFLESSKTKLVLTADSNAFICAESDPRYKRIFSEAALVTPDSAGPVWAMGRYGHPVPDRVSGVEIVDELCKLSVSTGATMYFLGAAPEVAQDAARALVAKYPGCKIVGTRNGIFNPSEDKEVAAEIAELKPDILLVGMGMPRQECFILDTAEIIKAKIGIGVGGSFDVHSGRVRRAPKLIQTLRLEWLWRTILNPKKFAKVKNLPLFYIKVRKATR